MTSVLSLFANAVQNRLPMYALDSYIVVSDILVPRTALLVLPFSNDRNVEYSILNAANVYFLLLHLSDSVHEYMKSVTRLQGSATPYQRLIALTRRAIVKELYGSDATKSTADHIFPSIAEAMIRIPGIQKPVKRAVVSAAGVIEKIEIEKADDDEEDDEAYDNKSAVIGEKRDAEGRKKEGRELKKKRLGIDEGELGGAGDASMHISGASAPVGGMSAEDADVVRNLILEKIAAIADGSMSYKSLITAAANAVADGTDGAASATATATNSNSSQSQPGIVQGRFFAGKEKQVQAVVKSSQRADAALLQMEVFPAVSMERVLPSSTGPNGASVMNGEQFRFANGIVKQIKADEAERVRSKSAGAAANRKEADAGGRKYVQSREQQWQKAVGEDIGEFVKFESGTNIAGMQQAQSSQLAGPSSASAQSLHTQGAPRTPGPRGAPLPSSSSSSSTTPTHPSSSSSSRSGSQYPLILVPSAASSLINMYNARDLLENMTYVPATQRADEMQAAGLSKPSSLNITRPMPDGTLRKFQVMEMNEKMTPSDYDRIVAVFMLGREWEQNRLPLGKSTAEFFSAVRAFALQFDDQPVNPVVAAWRQVHVLKISRARRFQDNQILTTFWNSVQEFLVLKKRDRSAGR
eukprot:ANDGO_08469.mRNA.1 Cell division cycle protein 73